MHASPIGVVPGGVFLSGRRRQGIEAAAASEPELEDPPHWSYGPGGVHDLLITDVHLALLL
jgi:hypothetical protein